MSQNSLHLSLPYIQGGQAQKHVTHNEAIRILDSVAQISVLSKTDAPTGTESDGNRHIVSATPNGDFADHAGEIATFENGGWSFLIPRVGWIAYDASSGGLVSFDGSGWLPITAGSGASAGPVTATSQLGINTAADTTNRLVSASDATLLTHDVTGGHQLKINKNAVSDTASLLFQSSFSGRAEMGTTGSDDFEIKVSPDGATFYSAMQVDGATGSVSFPNTTLTLNDFGTGNLVTEDYVISRAGGLVTNGSGYLANAYNYPSSFMYDPAETPNLPGAFSKAGHYSGVEEMSEFIAVDPNRLFRTRVYLRQEAVSGDWSGFPNADRHAQYMGLRCYDADGLSINASHHMRYHHSGTDSLTTLAAPLTPGDTTIQLTDASGWNDTSSSTSDRGVIVFGYRNAMGKLHDYYSRIEDIDLFDLGGVNKATGVVTLNQPFPAALGNPDDPAGAWPAGTRIANRAGGWNFKFAFCNALVLDQTETWYSVENAIGGVDLSGKNVSFNFPPGTASVRPIWMVNYSNRVGGWSTYPDTGSAQRLWVTGVAIETDVGGFVSRVSDGSCAFRAVDGDIATGNLSLVQPGLKVSPA